MTLELYWFSGSPYAWRVQLALAWKRIPWESHQLQLSQDQHRSPAFLALNPRGKVPVVRDGSYVLSESLAILAWLDRRHPDPSLFGETAEHAGLVWRALSEYTCYTDPSVENFTLPFYFGRYADRLAEIDTAWKVLRAEVGRLDACVATSPWVVPEVPGPTAADFVWYPALASLRRAAGKPGAEAYREDLEPMADRFPWVAAWMGRVEGIPGFAETVPPHWRAAPQP